MLKFGIDTLTEEELALLLVIVNERRPSTVPPIQFDRTTVNWFKHEALCEKVGSVFNELKQEGHPLFSSLLTKMGVQHEIKYEQPPVPEVTGSTEVTGSSL
jgi:hypothetical protein